MNASSDHDDISITAITEVARHDARRTVEQRRVPQVRNVPFGVPSIAIDQHQFRNDPRQQQCVRSRCVR
jgi:hypothetical protein